MWQINKWVTFLVKQQNCWWLNTHQFFFLVEFRLIRRLFIGLLKKSILKNFIFYKSWNFFMQKVHHSYRSTKSKLSSTWLTIENGVMYVMLLSLLLCMHLRVAFVLLFLNAVTNYFHLLSKWAYTPEMLLIYFWNLVNFTLLLASSEITGCYWCRWKPNVGLCPLAILRSHVS